MVVCEPAINICSRTIGKVIMLGFFISLLVISVYLSDFLNDCLSYELILKSYDIKNSKECREYLNKYFSIDEEEDEYDYKFKMESIKEFKSSINIFQEKTFTCKILIIISLVLVFLSAIFSCYMSTYIITNESYDPEDIFCDRYLVLYLIEFLFTFTFILAFFIVFFWSSKDFKNNFLSDFIKIIEACDINKLNNIDNFYNLDSYITAFRVVSIILFSIKIITNAAYIINEKYENYEVLPSCGG